VERRLPHRRMTWPRNTIRLRLTALYGALFLVSSAVLLAITYFFVAHRFNNGKLFVTTVGTTNVNKLDPTLLPGPGAVAYAAQQQPHVALHALLVESIFALGLMTIASIWLGWLVAGRALRPLRTITTAAQEISAGSLHRRLALNGPDDELTQLGET